MLLLYGDVNVNLGPTAVNNKNIPSTALPFYNCDEPVMSSSAIILTFRTTMTIPNGRFSNKLVYFILIINSLLSKSMNYVLLQNQSNASTIGISESKLD